MMKSEEYDLVDALQAMAHLGLDLADEQAMAEVQAASKELFGALLKLRHYGFRVEQGLGRGSSADGVRFLVGNGTWVAHVAFDPRPTSCFQVALTDNSRRDRTRQIDLECLGDHLKTGQL